MHDDPFDLARFTTAQTDSYAAALQELRAGAKRTHWMWFVFPQLRGLGHSSTAQVYGLASRDEARAYLAHDVLGPRLKACTQAVVASTAPSLRALFGAPDDLKFRSSMTLFDAVEPAGVFEAALDHWCAGERDPRTLALLEA